jgi:hypothetical protein
MPGPGPDPNQYLAALGKGSITRRAIGAAKRAIAAGEITAQAVFDGESEHENGVARARARTLLEAFPGIGSATAKEILEKARVDPEARVGALGWQTRAELLRLVLLSQETYGSVALKPARIRDMDV